MRHLPAKDRRTIAPAHLSNAPVFDASRFLPDEQKVTPADIFESHQGLDYCFMEDYFAALDGTHSRNQARYRLKAFFGEALMYITARDLRTVKPDHIFHYVRRTLKEEKGLLSQTMNSHMVSLSKLFKWCEKRGAPGVTNPIDWSQLRPIIGFEKKRPNPVLTDGEIGAMLRATLYAKGRRARLAERDYLVLLLLFNTGIRRSNVGRLMFHQFVSEEGHWIIHLPDTKAGVAQRVKVQPWLREKVMAYCDKRGIEKGPIFPATNGPTRGQPIQGAIVGRIFKNSVRMAQIREHTPGYRAPTLEETGGQALRETTAHLARHTFVTKMLGSGVTPIKAMQAARHKSFDTTLGYFEDLTRFDDYGGDAVHFDID